MSFLFESPATIGVLGAVVLVLVCFLWVQTGKNILLAIAGLVIVATIGLLILERSVVTDSEAVQAKLYEIAADLQANDSAKIASHIVQSRPREKARATSEMKMHHFTDVTIGKVHLVEPKPEHQPPEVDIEFNVSVSGSFFNGQFPRDGEQRWVRLVFWKEDDGQWRIADYEHDEPTRFMHKRKEK